NVVSSVRPSRTSNAGRRGRPRTAGRRGGCSMGASQRFTRSRNITLILCGVEGSRLKEVYISSRVKQRKAAARGGCAGRAGRTNSENHNDCGGRPRAGPPNQAPGGCRRRAVLLQPERKGQATRTEP